MIRLTATCTFALTLLCGCFVPTAKPAPAHIVRISVYRSQPMRTAQDTSMVKDAGPAAVSVVAALVGGNPVPIALGIVAGDVARRLIERTSDAEFRNVVIDVPAPTMGTVIVTVPIDGSVQVIRHSEADAALAMPGDGVDDLVARWLKDARKLPPGVRPK